jgi:hypothetical protein
MWGSEGKGTISIVIANAAIVSFFSSIFAGSSTSILLKIKTEQILVYSYIWSVGMGILIPVIFSFADIQAKYLMYLIGISVFSALLSVNVNLFIGTRNIRLFNIYTVLQQLVHVVFIGVFIYILNLKDVSVILEPDKLSCTFIFDEFFPDHQKM